MPTDQPMDGQILLKKCEDTSKKASKVEIDLGKSSCAFVKTNPVKTSVPTGHGHSKICMPDSKIAFHWHALKRRAGNFSSMTPFLLQTSPAWRINAPSASLLRFYFLQ